METNTEQPSRLKGALKTAAALNGILFFFTTIILAVTGTILTSQAIVAEGLISQKGRAGVFALSIAAYGTLQTVISLEYVER